MRRPSQATVEPGPARDWPWFWIFGAVALAVVAAWLVRVTGPANFSGDQMKPMAYVLDVVKGGNWIVQTDFSGAITSKPPLYTWLATLSSAALGEVSALPMYVPTGLGILGTALAAAWIGRRWFGDRAGLYAGLFVVLTPLAIRNIAFARTDALFTFWITIAALCALRAWSDRGGTWWWLGFWIACALSVLTKGPLGIPLAAFGLVAAIWERTRSGRSEPSGSAQSVGHRVAVHGLGLTIVLVLGGGWFLLAYSEVGQALVDKQIGDELIGHASKGPRPLPIGYFFTTFFPWSFLAAWGMIRAVRKPETDPARRRTERFLTCWIVLAVLMFSLSSHQRHDHLLPLLAPMAVLAGREFARLTAGISDRRQMSLAAGISVVLLLVTAVYFNGRTARVPDVALSEATLDVARQIKAIEARDGQVLPLTLYNAPSFLEFALGQKAGEADKDQMLRVLDGDEPVFLAANNPSVLERISLVGGREWHVWAKGSEVGKLRTGEVYATVPPGRIPTSGAFYSDGLVLRFDRAAYFDRSFGVYRFRFDSGATLLIENTAAELRVVAVRETGSGRRYSIRLDGFATTNLDIRTD